MMMRQKMHPQPLNQHDAVFHGIFRAFDVCDEDFYIHRQIGSGRDCVLQKATYKPNSQVVVLKRYNRVSLSNTKVRAVKREARMMYFLTRIRLSNVVQFYAAYQNEAHMVVVMQYCSGGDLLEKLLADSKTMAEQYAVSKVIRPMLKVLCHLHDHYLIHRDIKLENIFLDDRGRVHLGDYGLSMSLKEERGISPVGTVEYMAPELHNLPSVEEVQSGRIDPQHIIGIDEKVDVWAIGVMTFEIICGTSPFEGSNKSEVKANVLRGIPKAFSDSVSDLCRDFIQKALMYDASKRPSTIDMLNHPFIIRERSKSRQKLPTLPSLQPTPSSRFRHDIQNNQQQADNQQHPSLQEQKDQKFDSISPTKRIAAASSLTPITPNAPKYFPQREIYDSPSNDSPSSTNSPVPRWNQSIQPQYHQRQIGTTNSKVGSIYPVSGAFDSTLGGEASDGSTSSSPLRQQGSPTIGNIQANRQLSPTSGHQQGIKQKTRLTNQLQQDNLCNILTKKQITMEKREREKEQFVNDSKVLSKAMSNVKI